jgi:DegV family protein with EDD domain
MIRIITDTTCVLPHQEMVNLEIPFLPQIIIFGEDSYRDDTEIDTETFLSKLRASSSLPKTAAPPPALYGPIYQDFIDRKETMVVITPSSEISGTFRSASIAAQEFPQADIRIIDTRTVAGGLGQIVLQAHDWIEQGMEIDELVKHIEDFSSRNRTYFVVDTLEYLYKGGRIGGAQALFGSLLQVKPILKLKNGRTEAVESQRTKKRAIARMKELILSECPHNQNARFSISHCDALDEAESLRDYFASQLDLRNIPIYQVPPAIVVHGGPKIISLSFFTENQRSD